MCPRYSCCNCRFVGQMARNVYGYGSGQIWLDDIRCSGSESSVGECTHSGWGVHDCSHFEDVAVSCQTPITPPNSPSRTCHSHALQFVSCVFLVSCTLCLKPCTWCVFSPQRPTRTHGFSPQCTFPTMYRWYVQVCVCVFLTLDQAYLSAPRPFRPTHLYECTTIHFWISPFAQQNRY